MTNAFFFFYLITAAVWAYRARRALRALRENPVVQRRSSLPPERPRVSILLPVKNEEVNLEECLKGLLSQDYTPFEIIVVNDHSVDRTPVILSQYAQLYPDKIRRFDAPDVPEGWTGKNAALAHGAGFARGEWLLFTDADTRHLPWALTSVLAHTMDGNLDLLTLSPRCLAESFWEKTLQPPAMLFTGLWFPFSKVNRPGSSLVFGNGQFLFIRRKVYDALGGHTAVKEAYLEDFALVRKAKSANFRIECAMGTSIFGTRMYRSLPEIWRGWRRIFLYAFEKKVFRLIQKSLALFLFSFLPFLFLPFLTNAAGQSAEILSWIWGTGGVVVTLILLVTLQAHRLVGAPVLWAFFHPVAGLILAGILLDSAWTAVLKKPLKWR